MKAKLKIHNDKLNGSKFIEVWNKQFFAIYDVDKDSNDVSLRQITGNIKIRQVQDLTDKLSRGLNRYCKSILIS